MSFWLRGANNIGGKLDCNDVKEFWTEVVLCIGFGAERAVDLWINDLVPLPLQIALGAVGVLCWNQNLYLYSLGNHFILLLQPTAH